MRILFRIYVALYFFDDFEIMPFFLFFNPLLPIDIVPVQMFGTENSQSQYMSQNLFIWYSDFFLYEDCSIILHAVWAESVEARGFAPPLKRIYILDRCVCEKALFNFFLMLLLAMLLVFLFVIEARIKIVNNSCYDSVLYSIFGRLFEKRRQHNEIYLIINKKSADIFKYAERYRKEGLLPFYMMKIEQNTIPF